ncbi:hypothetical protein BASA62_000177 [Batrachochytrium salamandrivorans]|nr:hypothetical protein BASA62_000177 [Batrachochytrium salamandrivorans]
MKWSKAAWEEISMDTVANCFHYTGLFAGPPQSSVPNMEEQNLEGDLCDAIQRLPPNNPMAIEELSNPVIENYIANLELNDDEIVAMVEETEEEDDDPENENVVVQEITKEEKLKSLSITASLLDVTDPTDNLVFKRIRKLQKSLKMTATVQTAITSWFASK